MIESIFITTVIIGTLLFILSIEKENILYSLTSILMWIVVMAGQVYIYVPEVDYYYTEWAYFAISIAFIIINLMWTIILYMDLDFWRKHGM
jgi:hypothetical protein